MRPVVPDSRRTMGELAGVYLAAHTPRYCTEAAAFEGKLAHPDFRELRDGLVAQGRHLAALKPDVILINSCHLVSTFATLVDGTPRHRGILTAQEAPDLIAGIEFDFPGEPELASAIVERGRSAGRLCGLVDDPHYPLDYGTVMPIVCYLDRGQSIPVVPISVTLLNDLEECFEWGRHIVRSLRESERRGVFVASGALSHRLVRGPERWPLPEHMELDRKFAGKLAAGEYEENDAFEAHRACACRRGDRHRAGQCARSTARADRAPSSSTQTGDIARTGEGSGLVFRASASGGSRRVGGRDLLNLLLDTHALLWWSTSDAELSRKAKRAIASEDIHVFVSAVTAWEIATKVRMGKLEWPATAGTVHDYVLEQGFRALPISLVHAERAGQLAIPHRDPFDRMLMAQALAEDMWLASNEDVFDTVGVKRYW